MGLAAQNGRQPPPSDVPAETSLLAALLWCGTYAPNTHTPSVVIDLIDRAEMMFLPAHIAIWAAMLALKSRDVPCDVTAVHSELVRQKSERIANGLNYLEQLIISAVPATVLKLREYAESVRETWLRRHLIELARDLHTQARNAKGDASEIAAGFAVRLSDTAGKGARDASFVHVSVPLSRTMRKAQAPASNEALTTGFAKVDELLLGGLRRRQVTILGARTSVGKSALALEIAISAHEARPSDAVLYVSMEMTEDEFTDRMVSSRAKVDMDVILRGEVSDAEYERMLEVNRQIRGEEIYFNVRQNLTLTQIRGMASKVSRETQAKGKRLGLIVVDHIGLVKPDERKPSREQEVANTSRGLRDLANDYDCHVLGLAQIGRESEKQAGKSKMPQLHHLRESGSIEQDTNNVLILHRERDKDGLFPEGKPAKLAVAKARNGRLGLAWLAVEPRFVRFSPWETSDQAKSRPPSSRANRNHVAKPEDGIDDDGQEYDPQSFRRSLDPEGDA
jgi:replicative DNA helicase